MQYGIAQVFFGLFFLETIFFAIEMAQNLSRIRELTEAVTSGHEAFVVDLRLRGELHNQVLEIFVDTDSGITADGCAAISRDLSVRLDHDNIFPGRYQLVVSSPDLERPLRLPRQYRKNLGRNLRVRFRSPEKVKTIVGRLIQVTEEGIVLEEKGTREGLPLPFDVIAESKVEIDWGPPSK